MLSCKIPTKEMARKNLMHRLPGADCKHRSYWHNGLQHTTWEIGRDISNGCEEKQSPRFLGQNTHPKCGVCHKQPPAACSLTCSRNIVSKLLTGALQWGLTHWVATQTEGTIIQLISHFRSCVEYFSKSKASQTDENWACSGKTSSPRLRKSWFTHTSFLSRSCKTPALFFQVTVGRLLRRPAIQLPWGLPQEPLFLHRE